MNRQTDKSATDLVAEIIAHVGGLVRNEVDLARSEVNDNLNRAVTSLGLLAAALVMGITALNVLAAALVSAIAETGIEPGWAALIVGVVFAVIAYVMMNRGLHNLKLTSIAPKRAAENTRRDMNAVREAYNAE
jgi:uncharacterized membrane protein YqjE